MEVIVKGLTCALDSAVIALISKAKAFGRSRSCLTRLNHGKAIKKFFPTGAVDISRTLQASRIPSYAKMTARPPPPHKRVGEGGRESGMVATGQGRGAVVEPPNAMEVGFMRRHCVRVWDGAGSQAGTPLVVAWQVVEVDFHHSRGFTGLVSLSHPACHRRL